MSNQPVSPEPNKCATPEHPIVVHKGEASCPICDAPSVQAGARERMETQNKSFNDEWNYLATVFPSANLPNGWSLALDKKPRIANDKEWVRIVAAVVTVTLIGQRNLWLSTHVDYRGRPVLFYVPNDYESAALKAAQEGKQQ